MTLKTIFRSVLFLQIILLISAVIVDSHLISQLPDILQEYLYFEEQQEISDSEALLFLLIYPLILLFFASVIGLLFFKKWAKYIYVCSSIIMFFIAPFLGPTVEHGLTTDVSP